MDENRRIVYLSSIIVSVASLLMRTLSRLNFYGTHFFSVELIEGKVLDFVVSQKVVQLPLDLVVADSKSPQRSSPPEEVAVA